MKEDESYEHVILGSDDELTTADVRGYDFRGEFDFHDLIESYETTGFQATHLAEAVDIAERMQEEKATIYLTFTSNIISSGLREVVAYLVREGYVDVLITTSGALTEDVIKTAKPFKMGKWNANEATLRDRGINRLGNIFVPSDRYVWLEEYLYDFFDDFFANEKVRTPTAFARELGETLDDEDSVLKQAADNDVPIYCPALTDAEVGNFLYYYRQGYDSEVGIEILDDYDSLIEDGLLADTTGLITVGGGMRAS
ncbi:deoxyhypusine synthase [Natrialba aegyptia DSM 13077]|uniref:Deoxyhypusine synthase n=1 Tax=Natrialba aegyptia DSM 13077 TaxID=1227491 RepID=M0AQ25_9EURY|nr:deoxyhypusine synthase [Natrialba aegyptia DSM 13077]